MDIAYIKVTVDEHRYNKVWLEINSINGVVNVDELIIKEEE
tara:strand:+ start:1864 stop:1986 length:123 start_codon:yes stop_codon:yes gene_type:complete